MNKDISSFTVHTLSYISSPEIVLILLLLMTVFILLRRCKILNSNLEKLLSQKKSSEVRTGKISEVLAPISGLFPVDVKKAGTSTVFMGQPIDYIYFDPDEGITFIEIKSGNSALSTGQKKLKEAIEEGRVFWEEVRIK